MSLLYKMYGGSLKPRDPRRFLIEAIVGAMTADGVINPAEMEALERNLQESELFSGLGPDAVRMLIEMAKESIDLAGGCRRRVPAIARHLPARSHRLAAYAIACEITYADGETPEEERYLEELRRGLLISDDEARAISAAAHRRQGLREVEDRTREMQGSMPWFVTGMAIMAALDGHVTAAEREAMIGVLRCVGDLAVMSEGELAAAVDAAFRRIDGKDLEMEVRQLAASLPPNDRYWAAVYMMVVVVADGYTNWRQQWIFDSVKTAFRMTDADMDRAMEAAKLFPVPRPMT